MSSISGPKIIQCYIYNAYCANGKMSTLANVPYNTVLPIESTSIRQKLLVYDNFLNRLLEKCWVLKYSKKYKKIKYSNIKPETLCRSWTTQINVRKRTQEKT